MGPTRSIAAGAFALLLTRPALADEGVGASPVHGSAGLLPVVVGGATALVPLAVGAASMTQMHAFERKNVGFLFAGAGFALAPFFAHGVVGEWGRGAIFSLPSLGAEGGMVGIAAGWPDGVFAGTRVTRTFFVGLFTASAFASVIGIVDAALVDDRRRGRGFFGSADALPRFSIAPGAGDTPCGVTLTLVR